MQILQQIQEQNRGADHPPKRRATNTKHVHFERAVAKFDKKHTLSNTPLPAKSKNIFFESYTDSPEFTHVDNPVVYMEEVLLPEEQGLMPEEPERSPPPPTPIALSRAREQHPLSQVSLPDGSSSYEYTRRGRPVERPVLGSSVHRLQRTTSMEYQHSVIQRTNHDVILIGDDDDDDDQTDDEEPEDDTFDFLSR